MSLPTVDPMMMIQYDFIRGMALHRQGECPWTVVPEWIVMIFT